MTKLLKKSGFVIEQIHPTATEFSIIEAKKMNQIMTFKNIVEEYAKRVSY